MSSGITSMADEIDRLRLELAACHEALATADLINAGSLEALHASVNAGDSHYAHWDSKGTAGANCPACRARYRANELAYIAIVRATNPVTTAIASGRALTMEEVAEVVNPENRHAD